MKRRDIAEVVLKLLGVLGVVYAALRLPALIGQWHSFQILKSMPDATGMTFGRLVLPRIITMLIYLAGGVVLIVLGDRIAEWIMALGERDRVGTDQWRLLSPEGFRFCLRLLAFYVLLTALPDLAKALFGLATAYPSSSWSVWRVLISPLLRTGIGFYLLLGGDALVKIAWRRQNATEESLD